MRKNVFRKIFTKKVTAIILLFSTSFVFNFCSQGTENPEDLSSLALLLNGQTPVLSDSTATGNSNGNFADAHLANQERNKALINSAFNALSDGSFTYDEFITITSSDGTKLKGNLFLPNTNDPSARFPAIVFVNSWALEEHEYIVQAAKFAKKGYIVLSYSTRGFGLSGGLINVAGPKDMQDLSAALDFLEANSPVDTDNIGMAGISYGAGISLLGLATESRIKTAVPMSGWANLIDSLYGAESPRLVWSGLLVLAGYLTGRMDPIIAENNGKILTHSDIPAVTAWAMQRSPRTYIDALNAAGKPVYLSNNFSDNLFQPNSVMDFYRDLTVPKRLDLNQGVHATAEIAGVLGLPNFIWSNAHDWFDYWLKGIDTGIMDREPVTMERKFTSERNEFSNWPAPSVADKTFYFKPRSLFSSGKLLTSPNSKSGTPKIYSGLDTTASSGIPLLAPILEAHLDVPVKTWISSVSRTRGVSWTSSSISSGLKIRGIPAIRARITPSRSRTSMAAYLYDVNAWGKGTLITHGTRSLIDVPAGSSRYVDIDLVAVSYNLPAGHKLAVVVDTFDLLYSPATLGLFSLKFHHSSSVQNTLTVPVQD